MSKKIHWIGHSVAAPGGAGVQGTSTATAARCRHVRRFREILSWGLVLVLWVSTPGWSQHAPQKNPFRSPEDLEEGRRLYGLNCSACHGMDGASGRGAKLATKNHRYGNSDEEMFQTISNGIPGTAMPGLWLDKDSIWKILLFVRTFKAGEEKPCISGPGDPGRGRVLFVEKGRCGACHRRGMTGGRLGPELSNTGSTHTRQQLREALFEPHNDVTDPYRTVRVVGRDGARFEGVLMNEDGYTLHMMDRQENIHSFLKPDLAQIERPSQSLMPAYRGVFNPQELDDLLAYLCSLEDNPKAGNQ